MDALHADLDGRYIQPIINAIPLPSSITHNLRMEVRAYQAQAFRRFMFVQDQAIPGQKKPNHLLFNMATGSGKTMIMAGLMLHLYEKGYRNFLFFVNSNNIIQKTKANFLLNDAAKYLFTELIVINGKAVVLKEVTNFEEADLENINIKFTTIQQLHIDLHNTKENSLTFEDFKTQKICLIADEAHHLSAGTRGGTVFGSWEGTVLEILNESFDNLLLEFTATLDYDSREIAKKYEDKVLYKYDLKAFRHEKYSKEISIIQSEYDEQARILQALILNTYRQELSILHGINLKPVILFKAKKTIAESEQNKANFHILIENLTAEQVENISKTSTVSIVKKAFLFFENANISIETLTKRIKSNFKTQNCLSANESDTTEKTDKKKREIAEQSDFLLNTLEENGNPIRAIFAVQKLNEGWDVLNLFDIVRLYEGQNTGGSNKKVGATTVSEAQLIGRGARYFPFKLNETDDKYKRKFDDDATNDLKVLEELYYHTKYESQYISELKKALIESGAQDDEYDTEERKLILKPEFQATDFYNKGRVFYNKKIEKDFKTIFSFDDLGVKNRNLRYTLSSGKGSTTGAFHTENNITDSAKNKQKDIKTSEIPSHILKFALSQNSFFYFNKITRYFPNIGSITNFISNIAYFGGLSITFIGTKDRIDTITNQDYLHAIQLLLTEIESEIHGTVTQYKGSDFVSSSIHEIFKNKTLRIPRKDERLQGQEDFLKDKNWYGYNANYGTSEEKEFVQLFARKFEAIESKYDQIYLMRNERALKIHDPHGNAFEPDFLLFCQQKDGSNVNYQIFIEPKGIHLAPKDRWKEQFLEILQNIDLLTIETDKYRIVGMPFFNTKNENDFKTHLETLLNI